NGSMKIILNRTYISLATSKYERWENFVQTLQLLLDALFEIYSPAFITRISLRYINIIDKDLLGLKDSEWKELIQPEFLGLLSSDFRNSVREFQSTYEINLKDNISKVRLLIWLLPILNSGKTNFMINSDFYCAQKLMQKESMEKLYFLHLRSTRFIRKIITDKLHIAMEPTDYEHN
ncbi:MAG: TIGR04255 family protein, partial [Ignavibacteriaceae bacterium]